MKHLPLPETPEQAEDFLRLAEEIAAKFHVKSAERERIDWLEIQANKPGGLLLHDGTERGRRGLGLRPGSADRSLREAIDDARKSQAYNA